MLDPRQLVELAREVVLIFAGACLYLHHHSLQVEMKISLGVREGKRMRHSCSFPAVAFVVTTYVLLPNDDLDMLLVSGVVEEVSVRTVVYEVLAGLVYVVEGLELALKRRLGDCVEASITIISLISTCD